MPAIESLFTDLAAVIVPTEPIHFVGSWSSAKRRTYASRSQEGSGEGPYGEVIDWSWNGKVDGLASVAGIAFWGHPRSGWYWVKSERPSTASPLRISFTGWAEDKPPTTLTFGGSFHGAHPPSGPVTVASAPSAACVLRVDAIPLGQFHAIAAIDDMSFALVLLPQSALRMGRNGLWRLREDLAARLNPATGDILTRRRSGRFLPTDSP